MLPSLADLGWLVGEAPVPVERLRSPMERAGAVAVALAAWQILPWTAPRIRAASPVVDASVRVLESAEVAVRLHVAIQEQIVERLTTMLDARGVRFVLLKGAALRRVAWPEPAFRASWDIDVGVAPADLAETERCARTLGFFPAIRERPSGRFVPAPVLFRAILESHNHELCAMVREARISDLSPAEVAHIEAALPALGRLVWDHRGGLLMARMAIDIHHRIDPMLPLDACLAGCERARGVPAPSRAWATVHAARTLFRQGERDGARLLHALADLARLVSTDDRPALADALRATTPLPPIPALAELLRGPPPDLGALLRVCVGAGAMPRLASSTRA